MPNRLLIDGDILVYRMGYAVQSDIESNTPENACYLCKKLIKDLKKKFNTRDVKVFLSADDRSNFRFKVAVTQPYKGHRKKEDRPIHYDTIRTYLVQNHGARIITGIEADDALGIEQVRCLEKGNVEPILVSVDKDLDMIPGKHYNFVQDRLYTASDPGELFINSTHKKLMGVGVKWFYAQMLMGDKADNIPGLKGYGPVKTYAALAADTTEKEMLRTVVQCYELELFDEGFTREKLVARIYEVADLLWMQRYPGQRKSQEIKEWGFFDDYYFKKEDDQETIEA